MTQVELPSSVATPKPPPGNLPGSLTSFIGRQQETAEVKHLLSQHRLLTLTGPGGAGKTRLALQVAQELHSEYRDGVWLVELAALSDPSLVPQALAAVLGVSEQTGQPLSDSLVTHLRPRHTLLLLDNCEHLLDACARLSATLLAACPGLRLLATSREPLGVPGEGVWAVPPLSLPAPRPWHGPASGPESIASYEQSEAVALFVARARSAAPDFALTVENGPWVAEICRRLDGLPLALELAAARVRALSVRQIAEHLDNRFQLLTSRLRVGPQRHQTLEATLDWSHDLLSTEERVLLRRLAVFASGWTLAAAEQVCAGNGLQPQEVLDLLTNLVDKSLVIVESRPGRWRYHHLETIRQYAHRQLLAAGEDASARDKHLDYYLQWAESSVPNLYAADQPEWLEHFDTEHDNLRAALDWSRDKGDGKSNFRLAIACGRFWQSRGYFLEGQERLQATLQGLGTPQLSEERAMALVWAAELAYAQSDYAMTTLMAEESVAIARHLDPAAKPILTWALTLLGRATTEMGEYDKATPLFEEALAIYHSLDDKVGIASMLMELGWAVMRAGDSKRAEAYLFESLQLSRQLGDIFLLGFDLSALGELAIRQGDFERARTLLEESLAHRQKLGDQWGMAISLGSLGWAALRQQHFNQARELLSQSLTIRLAINDQGGIAWCLEKLAEVIALEVQGISSAHRPRALEKCVCLLGVAHHLRASLNSTIDAADLPAYNQLLDGLRTTLDPISFNACWDKGIHLPLSAARDLALESVSWPAGAAASPGAQQVYGGLSVRERQTAALIAQGKSNREIAEIMTVGVKTVETYVTRILNKLGFDSRVQVAVWAVEAGLLPTND